MPTLATSWVWYLLSQQHLKWRIISWQQTSEAWVGWCPTSRTTSIALRGGNGREESMRLYPLYLGRTEALRTATSAGINCLRADCAHEPMGNAWAYFVPEEFNPDQCWANDLAKRLPPYFPLRRRFADLHRQFLCHDRAECFPVGNVKIPARPSTGPP